MSVWKRVREAWLRWVKRAKARLLGAGNGEEIREVRAALELALKQGELKQSGFQHGTQAPDPSGLSGADKVVYERIVRRTKQENRNNVTRTQAYWEVYQKHPELHWALLAHMVSRNGGYNMTDLKGELLPRLMEAGERERFFGFLERANYLIFGDAYPQLLLYEASRERGRPFFHLLPYFGVSRFMAVIWERFWRTRDSELLTLALVVNEQNYIEKRVVRHERYRAVVESFEFQAQTLLNLTQVVFPYVQGEREPRVQLAGVVVDSFTSLSERIDTGRRLYAILFGRQEVLRGVLAWAEQTPHTGSRADYWPHVFTAETDMSQVGDGAQQGAKQAYVPRVADLMKGKKGVRPLYSARLADAWPDVRDPEPPERYDWCRSAEAAEELYPAPVSKSWRLTNLFAQTLGVIERMAALETQVDKAGF